MDQLYRCQPKDTSQGSEVFEIKKGQETQVAIQNSFLLFTKFRNENGEHASNTRQSLKLDQKQLRMALKFWHNKLNHPCSKRLRNTLKEWYDLLEQTLSLRKYVISVHHVRLLRKATQKISLTKTCYVSFPSSTQQLIHWAVRIRAKYK